MKVYNFEVEDNHYYYVSEKGVLVHSNCGVAAIIERMLSSVMGNVPDMLVYYNNGI